MKIGITYDLKDDYLKAGFNEEDVAEFDKIETIDGIDNTLRELGYITERIGHIKNLCKLLNEGKSWDLVFNICEGMYGLSREAQVPALLDAYNIPYVFSNPLVLALTLNKAMTKQVIRDCGLATPDFAVVYTLDDIRKVELPYPLFAKPLAEGTGKGIYANSVINTEDQLHERCTDLLVRFNQPVLVETYLPGREFTIGIVGTGAQARTVGVMEILLNNHAESGVYSFLNKDDYENRVAYKKTTGEIAHQCETLALASYRCLGCEDGGRVDVRFNNKGIVSFIEINPLAGLNPVHSDLPILSRLNGISYKQLLEMIMNSAVQKVLDHTKKDI